MKSFTYLHARTVREACRLLGKYEGRARIMAGGTDLLGVLKDEILPEYPSALVNLKTIPGLDAIREDRNGLTIGALATLSAVATSPVVRDEYAALAQAAHEVGSPQLRNVGTIGGNLCQETRCWYYRYPRHVGGPLVCLRKGSGPCLAVKGDNRYHAVLGGKRCFSSCPSDTAIALAALDATLAVAGPGGKRQIPVREFHTVLGTVLQPAEIVTHIRVPKPPPGATHTFLKFTVRKPVDFAIASVATVVRVDRGVCTDVRIALGAVAPFPVRATAAEETLKGKPLSEAAAAQAAKAALAGAKPLDGNAYKVEIAKTLIQRALLRFDRG